MHIILLVTLFSECIGLILNETTRDPPRITMYDHVTAAFGVQLSKSSYERSAPLVAIKPENGCGDIENVADIEGAIVIIKRGQCEFFTKAWKVASYGGIGLVVGGNTNGNMLFRSKLLRMSKSSWEKREVDIPCLFISKPDYNSATEAISQAPTGSIFATISAEGEFPIDNFWNNPGLNIAVTYIFLVSASVVLVWVFPRILKRLKQRIVRRQVRGIPEVFFSSDLLGVKKLNNEHLTNACCPVCLENFKEQTKIKLLRCDHGFHPKCIEPWIRDYSDTCPICRGTVLAEMEEQRETKCCICCCWELQTRQCHQRLLSTELDLQAREDIENPNTTEANPSSNAYYVIRGE